MTDPKRPTVFDFFPLEDRILLSGSSADSVDQVDNPEAEYLDALIDQVGGHAAPIASWSDTPQGEPPELPDTAEAEQSVADAPAPVLDPERPLEVIFVDARVEDADVLINQLRSADGESQWMVVRLDAQRDGIDQITAVLQQLSDVDAVHLLSHGDGQSIQLGATRLATESMSAYAGDLTRWSTALDVDADLLIYGCDLAATESGRELIESLAVLCDCDVAASDDRTGAADLGGD